MSAEAKCTLTQRIERGRGTKSGLDGPAGRVGEESTLLYMYVMQVKKERGLFCGANGSMQRRRLLDPR